MPRAELEDLLKRYRRVWQKRHDEVQHVLRWQTPGAVWAMDFTEAPPSIDGLYPYLLAVRDLASGQQLLGLPVPTATAAETAVVSNTFSRSTRQARPRSWPTKKPSAPSCAW